MELWIESTSPPRDPGGSKAEAEATDNRGVGETGRDEDTIRVGLFPGEIKLTGSNASLLARPKGTTSASPKESPGRFHGCRAGTRTRGKGALAH